MGIAIGIPTVSPKIMSRKHKGVVIIYTFISGGGGSPEIARNQNVLLPTITIYDFAPPSDPVP